MEELEKQSLETEKQQFELKNTFNNTSKTSKSRHDFLLLLCLLFIFVVIIAFLIGRYSTSTQSHVQTKNTISPTSQGTIVLTPRKQDDLFITDKTLIAKTLNLPPLYSPLRWTEVAEQSFDDGISVVRDYDKDITIPFKMGKYYKASSQSNTDNVGQYYQESLSKKDWVTSNNVSSLHLKNMELSPIIASGVCGGIRSFLGYKNGMVRLVAIKYNVVPCNLLDKSPNKNVTQEYTLFVSDSVSIAPYIKN